MGTNGQQPFARIRDCTCPGTPHPEGDIVFLREFLDFAAGSAALRVIVEAGGDQARLDELVGPVYLAQGPIGWNVVDEDGPVEFSLDAIAALPFEQAYEIVNKADDLYTERVVRPLLLRLSASSNGMPTASTSQTRRSGQKTRKQRSRSSPVTSADGTSQTV